jgi:hypothetical protein
VRERIAIAALAVAIVAFLVLYVVEATSIARVLP